MATLCRLLGVSRSGYYAWRTRPPSARARRTRSSPSTSGRCMSRVAAPMVRHASGPNCGTAAWCALASVSPACCTWRVCKAVTGAKDQPSPRRTPGVTPAPDLVRRDFAAPAPDRLWVADITYVPTWAGFLYLAVVLDAHSRRIVGWAMADHLRSELVIEAVDMAVWRRRPTQGVIHHSDQGSQYTSLGLRTATARSWARRLDGESWRLLRQCDG